MVGERRERVARVEVEERVRVRVSEREGRAGRRSVAARETVG